MRDTGRIPGRDGPSVRACGPARPAIDRKIDPRACYSANTSCRVVRTADRVLAVTAPSRLTRRILSTDLI
jgi:hypothetical protein